MSTLSRTSDDLPSENPDDYPLQTSSLTLAGHPWHLTMAQSEKALLDRVQTDDDLDRFPYGLMLWPSALGLADLLTAEPLLVARRRVLEIGAGLGLPGMVAQRVGGEVTQSDHHPAALELAQHNALQNNVVGIRYLLADWRAFPQTASYERILGSDILYERAFHDDLYRLFEQILAPDGLLLLSDPGRPQAMEFVDGLERIGWRVTIESRLATWQIELQKEVREIAIFFVRR